MKITAIALAAALLTTSGAAAAQSATDVQCIILSNVFAKNSKDANAQKLAESSFYFYLGRVPDSATAAQLKTMFDQQAKGITDATAPNLMNGCVKAIQTRVLMLQSLSPEPQKQPPQGR